MPRLVLASASPRRAELLRSAGLDFEIRPVEIDESWRRGETPLAYVERVAAAKAEAAARGLDVRALVLAADTTVWLDEHSEPLAKPRDRDHAASMLRALTCGQPHRVTTACVFCRAGAANKQTLARVTETTVVHMRALSEAQFEGFIGAYLDAGDWADKAGAYAIQGRAAGLVEAIEGSYTSVVGLPLAQVLATYESLI